MTLTLTLINIDTHIESVIEAHVHVGLGQNNVLEIQNHIRELARCSYSSI